jgi:hypothetical protein
MARGPEVIEAAVSAAVGGPDTLSESGNLMAGKNPLWVARQHSHSITTMLRIYAAWAEDMVESDVDTIRRSMNRHAQLRPTTTCPQFQGHPASTQQRPGRGVQMFVASKQRALGNLAVHLAVEAAAGNGSAGMERRIHGGKGRTRNRHRHYESCQLILDFKYLPRGARFNLRRRTRLRSAEIAKFPQSDATLFAADCRERSPWVRESTGSGTPGDVLKPPSSPPATDRSRMA